MVSWLTFQESIDLASEFFKLAKQKSENKQGVNISSLIVLLEKDFLDKKTELCDRIADLEHEKEKTIQELNGLTDKLTSFTEGFSQTA